MFMIYRVHGKSKRLVEDCISTISEAREIAYASGPGRYAILSIRRAPGHRLVDTVFVPSPARTFTYETLWASA